MKAEHNAQLVLFFIFLAPNEYHYHLLLRISNGNIVGHKRGSHWRHYTNRDSKCLYNIRRDRDSFHKFESSIYTFPLV